MTPSHTPPITRQDEKQALRGSIAVKEEGSPDWCWQKLYRLTTLWSYHETTFERWREVLEELEQCRAWEVIPPEAPFGSLEAMLEAKGMDPKAARSEKAFEARLGDWGGDRKSDDYREGQENQGDAITLIRGTTGADYLRARLTRDAERGDEKARAALDKLSAGEIKSVRAAALDAGIVKPRISVPSDLQGIARYLVKKLGREQLTSLIDELRRALGDDQP